MKLVGRARKAGGTGGRHLPPGVRGVRAGGGQGTWAQALARREKTPAAAHRRVSSFMRVGRELAGSRARASTGEVRDLTARCL